MQFVLDSTNFTYLTAQTAIQVERCTIELFSLGDASLPCQLLHKIKMCKVNYIIQVNQYFTNKTFIT